MAGNEELKEKLSKFDFVRFTFADMHGISRSVITAQRNVPEHIDQGLYTLKAFDHAGPRMQVRLLGKLAEEGFPNGLCKPRPGTAHAVAWAGSDGDTVGEVLCGMYHKDGRPYEGCTIQAAKKQVQRLQDKGYKIFSAFEAEFALLTQDDQPAFEGEDVFSTLVQAQIENYLFTLDKKLAASGVELELLHNEYGPGQLEFTLTPQYGMKAVDNYFISKHASKEIAVQKGYKAVYITKPTEKLHTNGAHFTSSLWNDKNENVFSDDKDEKGLSQIARHWIAGLCLHGPALCALITPTVNCYRRFHQSFAPSHVSWAVGHRGTAFRAKAYGRYGACVENRLPSSAANPYLVLAATIAAGLDGIERKLPCPEETTDGTSSVLLPKTLQEALVALQEDDVIVQALGPHLINNFIENKKLEIKEFPNFEPNTYDPETLAKELEEYKYI